MQLACVRKFAGLVCVKRPQCAMGQANVKSIGRAFASLVAAPSLDQHIRQHGERASIRMRGSVFCARRAGLRLTRRPGGARSDSWVHDLTLLKAKWRRGGGVLPQTHWRFGDCYGAIGGARAWRGRRSRRCAPVWSPCDVSSPAWRPPWERGTKHFFGDEEAAQRRLLCAPRVSSPREAPLNEYTEARPPVAMGWVPYIFDTARTGRGGWNSGHSWAPFWSAWKTIAPALPRMLKRTSSPRSAPAFLGSAYKEMPAALSGALKPRAEGFRVVEGEFDQRAKAFQNLGGGHANVSTQVCRHRQ